MLIGSVDSMGNTCNLKNDEFPVLFMLEAKQPVGKFELMVNDITTPLKVFCDLQVT